MAENGELHGFCGPEISSSETCGSLALEALTILFVDDDDDARILMAEVLARAGAHVVVAASAAEAVGRIVAGPPHVVVSDIGLPDEDGYALIRAVRALPPDAGGRTPAIALTGHGSLEDRVRATSAGFQAHLRKPVEPALLLKTIAKLAWEAPPTAASARGAEARTVPLRTLPGVAARRTPPRAATAA